eukprot:14624762-Alexandrium_andersonii.AAC.1
MPALAVELGAAASRCPTDARASVRSGFGTLDARRVGGTAPVLEAACCLDEWIPRGHKCSQTGE